MILKLQKSLYGIREAGAWWGALLHKHMTSIGFQRCLSHPSLYHARFTGKENDGRAPAGAFALICTYVDDFLVATRDQRVYDYFIDTLKEKFKVKALGECDFILGLHLQRSIPDGTLKVSQAGFVKSCLERAAYSDLKPSCVPAATTTELVRCDSPLATTPAMSVPLDASRHRRYRQNLGCLNYLCSATRLDICNATKCLSKYGNCPSATHEKALKKVFAYLSHTRHEGLTFRRKERMELSAITDADYGGDPDSRKSSTGFAIMINGVAVHHRSIMQKTIAMSSCDAEIQAASACCLAIMHTRHILEEIDLLPVGPVVLRADNQASLRILQNPNWRGRLKYMQIHFLKCRECIEKGFIRPLYICSERNTADLLTKNTPRMRHEDLRRRLMGAQEDEEQDKGQEYPRGKREDPHPR